MDNFRFLYYVLLIHLCISCKPVTDSEDVAGIDPESEVIVKRRDDGTLSSVNQVDEWGIAIPGLKEYNRQGSLITSYPEIRFREVDQLVSKNKIDLEMFCQQKGVGVKYYLITPDDGKESRVYLISELGAASLEYYIQPGESIDKRIDIIAEIPTELGNILVQHLSYCLNAANPY